MRGVLLTIAVAIFATGTARADAPRVATDIPPVHALVAQVMAGVGAPDLVMRPGASPHGHSLRPSEAALLENADLVVWIGPGLTPWLDGALDALAGDAVSLTLTDVPGTTRLPVRSGARFEAHDHMPQDHDGEHAHAVDDHGDDHGDAHDHAPDVHDTHDAHDEAGHDHDSTGLDPHAWLDPDNAVIWLAAIADTLSRIDPDNAATYLENANRGAARIAAAVTDAQTILDPHRGGRFVVLHDAYQYFETRFDMPATGAISISDATPPGPARLAEIRQVVQDLDVTCVFAEPQFNLRLVETVTEATQARLAVLDPLGTDLEPGAAMYPALIRALAAEMANCL